MGNKKKQNKKQKQQKNQQKNNKNQQKFNKTQEKFNKTQEKFNKTQQKFNKNEQDNNNNTINNNSKKNRNKKERNAYRRKNKRNRQNDEIDEKFKKQLETLGYFIREVGGDGNCLFRSVSEQVEGNEHNFQEYREKCVNYMKENKDDFAPFIEDDEPFDKYVERMSQNGEWGGNLEIYALSKILEANFYIYILDQPMYIVKNFEKPKKNILLTYHEGKHYNSLRKLEEKNNEDKEKEEKRKKEKEKEDEDENEEGNEGGEESDNEEDEAPDDDIKDLISKVDHLNI
jgi:OTU domain-containing protein 3